MCFVVIPACCEQGVQSNCRCFSPSDRGCCINKSSSSLALPEAPSRTILCFKAISMPIDGMNGTAGIEEWCLKRFPRYSQPALPSAMGLLA